LRNARVSHLSHRPKMLSKHLASKQQRLAPNEKRNGKERYTGLIK